MFADLFHSRRPVPEYEHAFVAEGPDPESAPPDPRVERIILTCWILIAIKHVAVIWAVHHYRVPFHQLWVNAPTWLLAAVATAIYYNYHRRP
jgi:hypothetical protein